MRQAFPSYLQPEFTHRFNRMVKNHVYLGWWRGKVTGDWQGTQDVVKGFTSNFIFFYTAKGKVATALMNSEELHGKWQYLSNPMSILHGNS